MNLTTEMIYGLESQEEQENGENYIAGEPFGVLHRVVWWMPPFRITRCSTAEAAFGR